MAWGSLSGGNVGLIVASRRGAVEAAAAAAAAVAIVPYVFVAFKRAKVLLA